MFGQSGGSKKSEARKASDAARGAGVAVVKALYSRALFARASPVGDALAKGCVNGECTVQGSRYVFAAPPMAKLGTPERDTVGYNVGLFGETYADVALTKGIVGHLLAGPWKPEFYTTPSFLAIRGKVLAAQGLMAPNADTICFCLLFTKVDVVINVDDEKKKSTIVNESETPTILKQLQASTKIAAAMSIILQGVTVEVDSSLKMLEVAGLVDFKKNEANYRLEFYSIFSSASAKKKYMWFVIIYRWSTGGTANGLVRAIRKASKIAKGSPSLYGKSAAELEAALVAPTALDVLNRVKPQGKKKKKGAQAGAAEEEKKEPKPKAFKPVDDAPIGEPAQKAVVHAPANVANFVQVPEDSDSEDEPDFEGELLEERGKTLELQKQIEKLNKIVEDIQKGMLNPKDVPPPPPKEENKNDQLDWMIREERFSADTEIGTRKAIAAFLQTLTVEERMKLGKANGSKILVNKSDQGLRRDEKGAFRLSMLGTSVWLLKKV